MDINLIIGIIAMIPVYYFINKGIDSITEINKMKIMNRQYEIYMDVDIKKTEEMIDELVQKHMAEYILKEIIAQQVEYITKDQIESMIKAIDKSILLTLSDLYVFYIKLLTKVDSERDIIAYIHHKTNEHVLNYVTEFNKTK